MTPLLHEAKYPQRPGTRLAALVNSTWPAGFYGVFIMPGGKPNVERECVYCRKKFLTYPSEIKRGKGKFCSRTCLGKVHRQPWGGVNNPQYIDGNWRKRKSEYARRYEKKYPQKARAHAIFSNALRYGTLIKKPCQECGQKDDIHGHHEDYSKPLDITWLCAKCHRIWHGASC